MELVGKEDLQKTKTRKNKTAIRTVRRNLEVKRKVDSPSLHICVTDVDRCFRAGSIPMSPLALKECALIVANILKRLHL